MHQQCENKIFYIVHLLLKTHLPANCLPLAAKLPVSAAKSVGDYTLRTFSDKRKLI